MKETSKKRLNFRCRYQPYIDTREGAVLEYLRENYVGGLSKGLIESAILLWLPLALPKSSSNATIAKTGRMTVFALIRHIENLCILLGIDSSMIGIYFQENSVKLPIYNVGNLNESANLELTNTSENFDDMDWNVDIEGLDSL